MTYTLISLGLLIVSAVAAVILERKRPLAKFKVPTRVVLWDVLHWYVRVATRGLDVFMATASTVLLTRLLGSHTGYVGPAGAWPLWLQLIAIFLILDLVHWLVHFAHHKIPFLWKVHSVHHSPENLYWLAAFRRHFVQEILFDSAKVFTVVLLGFGTLPAFVYFASRVVFSIPAHANIRVPAGFLNYIFVTWESHRWHHTSDPTIRDKNMSLHFPWWDMVFGTFYCPKGKQPELLGVDGYPDYPTNFFVQQAVPFFYDRWSARAAEKRQGGSSNANDQSPRTLATTP
jgi:sterol desaturase/sphingolipid hydroxylase (fatty acid hydroxylase superfamily)